MEASKVSGPILCTEIESTHGGHPDEVWQWQPVFSIFPIQHIAASNPIDIEKRSFIVHTLL